MSMNNLQLKAWCLPSLPVAPQTSSPHVHAPAHTTATSTTASCPVVPASGPTIVAVERVMLSDPSTMAHTGWMHTSTAPHPAGIVSSCMAAEAVPEAAAVASSVVVTRRTSSAAVMSVTA